MIGSLKRFFSSKVGWAFVAVHSIAVIYSFWGRIQFGATECKAPSLGGWFWLAGRGIHLYYEDIVTLILFEIDYYALYLAYSITDLFGVGSICFIPASWIVAVVTLFFTSFQWFFVGKFIQAVISMFVSHFGRS